MDPHETGRETDRFGVVVGGRERYSMDQSTMVLGGARDPVTEVVPDIANKKLLGTGMVRIMKRRKKKQTQKVDDC